MRALIHRPASTAPSIPRPILQRRAGGPAPAVAPPIVHDVLRTPGKPLPDASRAGFERRMGLDLSSVRVHTDPRAAESARAANALAYTVGLHIVFGAGRFSPLTQGGEALLGHELMHVAQQRNASASAGPLAIADAASPLEREADRVAERVLLQRKPPAQPAALPTSLAGYPEEERKRIMSVQLPQADSTAAAIANIFNPSEAPKYPMDSVKVVFDPAIASNIRGGLTNVAGYLMGQSLPPLHVNETTDIDVAPVREVIRFTYLQHGKPVQDVMLIEQVGAIPAAAPAATTLTAGKAKFTAHKYKFGASWTSSSEKDQLFAALAAVPESALIDGLTFGRKGTISGSVGGKYEPLDHTVWMVDASFSVSITRAGLSTEITRLLAHELGHAADRKPMDDAFAVYRASKGKAADEKALTSARSLSGLRYKVGKSGMFDEDAAPADVSGDFRAAAKKDGVMADSSGRTTNVGLPATLKGAPTDYGNTKWEDVFAESFSLYVSDPDLLKNIRPNIYDYFVKKFPPQATATPAQQPGGAPKP